MNYLKKSVHLTIAEIKHHPKLFLLIIVVQALLLITVAAVGITYQMKIVTDLQNVVNPLQQANYDPDSLQEGQPFLADLAGVQRSYQQLQQNILEAVLIVALLYGVVHSGLWALSQKLYHHLSWKKTGKVWIKSGVASLLVFSAFGLLSYHLLRNLITAAFDVTFFSQVAQYLLITLGVLYYFLSIIYGIPTIHWKKNLLAIYHLGIKKIHYFIIPLGINVVLMLGTLYLFSLTTAQPSFLIIILAGFLFIVTVGITRIFFLANVQEIYEKNNH